MISIILIIPWLCSFYFTKLKKEISMQNVNENLYFQWRKRKNNEIISNHNLVLNIFQFALHLNLISPPFYIANIFLLSFHIKIWITFFNRRDDYYLHLYLFLVITIMYERNEENMQKKISQCWLKIINYFKHIMPKGELWLFLLIWWWLTWSLDGFFFIQSNS